MASVLGRAGVADHLDGGPGDDDQRNERQGTAGGVGRRAVDRDNGRRGRDSQRAREEDFGQRCHCSVASSLDCSDETSMKPHGFATVGISPGDASACRQPAQCLLPGGAVLGAELCSIWAHALEAALLEADERRVGERLKANVDGRRLVFWPAGLRRREPGAHTGLPVDHTSDLATGVCVRAS